MALLQISSQNITILDLQTPSQITIKNKTQTNILLKFLLTNPQQYKLSEPYTLLQPEEVINLKIQLNPGEALNKFNYKDNSLYVLHSKPDSNIKVITKNFQIGKQKSSIGMVRIPILIDIDLPILQELVEKRLKKYLKVTQVASPLGTLLKHSPFLQQLSAMFGKITSIIKQQSTIFINYEDPIIIVPQVILNSSKEKIIESVYACCYPTPHDLTSLENSQGLVFAKTDQVCVPSIITDFNQYDQILSCQDNSTLYLINISNRQVKTFNHQNFKIAIYPPYFCLVMEYKYLHFYQNWNQINVITIKLKKLEVKCFCRANNNLFAAGKNRSKLSFKQSTLRREILIYENFKVVAGDLNPSKKIRIQNSDEDVSMMICQNPYIFAYCKPTIYLINAQRFEIVIKLQRHLQSGILLEGRYLKSLISFIGITIQDRIIRINFDKMGVVYGVQIDESAYKAFSLAQTRQGKVFMNQRNCLCEFNPVMTEVKSQWKPKDDGIPIRMIKTNLKNQILMLRSEGKSTLVQFYKLDSTNIK